MKMKSIISKINPCEIKMGQPIRAITKAILLFTPDCACCALLRGLCAGLILGLTIGALL